MRKRFFPVLMALLILMMPGLSGCTDPETGEKEGLALILQEAGDIAGFFTDGIRDQAQEGPSGAVQPASEDASAQRLVPGMVHAEILESAYNRADKPVSVSSLGEYSIYLGKEYDFSPYKDILVPVDLSDDMSAERFVSSLETLGIRYSVRYENNPAQSGEMFALAYSGYREDNTLYMDSLSGVVIFASGEKKASLSGDRMIYLTFDDGPTKSGTEEILDILDTYGIKAAFFTLGSSVDRYPGSAKLIYDRGHSLGCHSYTHVYKNIYGSVWALGNEIDMWENAVSNAGIDVSDIPHLFRFPGGSVGSYLDDYTYHAMMEMLSERGYSVYDWNVVTNDAVLYTAPEGVNSYEYIRSSLSETLAECMARYGNTGAPVILLMHETVGETANLLKWVIEYLIDDGFSFGDLRDIDTWTFDH